MFHCTSQSTPQLETNLSKKDEIIAAKDRRIAALETLDSSAPTNRTAALHQYIQQTFSSGPAKSSANEVSDDSCDTESQVSFGSLGLSFLRHDSSQDEDDSAEGDTGGGRWNIPFDDSNEEDLVPKTSFGDVLPHATALSDVGFKSLADGSDTGDASGLADGLAVLCVSSPIKPIATRGAAVATLPFRASVSPIKQPARRGLARMDSNGSEKENVDPIRKRLSADKCTLSQEFGSPCR